MPVSSQAKPTSLFLRYCILFLFCVRHTNNENLIQKDRLYLGITADARLTSMGPALC